MAVGGTKFMLTGVNTERKSWHDGEKSAQITILPKEIEMQRRPQIMKMESKYALYYIFYFLIFMFTLCHSYYQKTEIVITGILILLKIFKNNQIRTYGGSFWFHQVVKEKRCDRVQCPQALTCSQPKNPDIT